MRDAAIDVVYRTLRIMVALIACSLVSCSLSPSGSSNIQNELQRKSTASINSDWLGFKPRQSSKGFTILGLQPGDSYFEAKKNIISFSPDFKEGETDGKFIYILFDRGESEVEVYALKGDDEIFSISIDEAISLEKDGKVLLDSEKSFVKVLDRLKEFRTEPFQSEKIVTRIKNYELVTVPTSSSEESGLIMLQKRSPND